MNLETYLYEIFEEKTKIKNKLNIEHFPIYLLDRYDLYECTLQKKNYTLLYLKENNIVIESIKKHIERIELITKNKCILVVKDIRRQIRNKMIANGIPFIDINKQVYLPFIYLLLDDTIRVNNLKVDKFTPSTQMIFIKLMLENTMIVNSAKLQKDLNMTAMTVSRGLRNLHSLQLLIEKGRNTRKTYQLIPKNDFFEIGRSYMINPVYKKVYIKQKPNNPLLFSNESALSNLSMLNPPKKTIYAIDKKHESSLTHFEILDEELADNEDCYILEFWKYDPHLLTSDNKNVDKYSLYSQLKDSDNERITIELDALLERI